MRTIPDLQKHREMNFFFNQKINHIIVYSSKNHSHQSVPNDYIIWGWGLLIKGNFTAKSAYAIFSGQVWDAVLQMWKIVWKCPGLQRIPVFLWLVLHNRLLTNVECELQITTYD
jgi:hypothetical protein